MLKRGCVIGFAHKVVAMCVPVVSAVDDWMFVACACVTAPDVLMR